jgi:hypothetical protein
MYDKATATTAERRTKAWKRKTTKQMDKLMRQGVKILLETEDALEAMLFKGRKRGTARWNPLDMERQRKYTMAQKWVKMTPKQSGRDALRKNIHLAEWEEVPELPDAQASAKHMGKVGKAGNKDTGGDEAKNAQTSASTAEDGNERKGATATQAGGVKPRPGKVLEIRTGENGEQEQTTSTGGNHARGHACVGR